MTQPALAQNIRGKGRHYEHPETGELVPSVTNIIGILDKPALKHWSAKLVAQAAWNMRHSLDAMGEQECVDVLKGSPWRNSGRAADRGTSVHDYLEAAATGRDVELEGEALTYKKGADDFLDRYKPDFVHTEFTVFGNGYAGTADVMAWMDGRLFVADYKTSKALYPEVALQLAAIRFADLIVVDGEVEEMPRVDAAAGVLVTPQRARVCEVRADADAFTAFHGLRQAWEWKHGADPIGAEVAT